MRRATYYSVKERMLEAVADVDSLFRIDHEALPNQILGILWKREFSVSERQISSTSNTHRKCPTIRVT